MNAVHPQTSEHTTAAALKFITCGSVDDGKSTLIGRLLVDSRVVLQDQLAAVSRSGAADLAQLTDGLTSEREQGITIDVAWRYAATPSRKFIIGDSPGHEQYTRNMVTAASQADAAVVLVDALKLPWASQESSASAVAHELLAQTRRHALLCHLLRVPSIVFAVNKLDAVAQPERAFARIHAALEAFAAEAGIWVAAIVPISALNGDNVTRTTALLPSYQGPSLLHILERLPAASALESHTSHAAAPFALPVQWVEKTASNAATTTQGRRVFWGRVAAGQVRVGDTLCLNGSSAASQTAQVAQVLSAVREPLTQASSSVSIGLVLDRELDVSRGDWLLAPATPALQQRFTATVAWMDEEPLVVGRTYFALHGHRWVKAKVARIVHQLNINTLAEQEATQLAANEIGVVELACQESLPVQPYAHSRSLGSLILVDTASHKTSGAVLVQAPSAG